MKVTEVKNQVSSFRTIIWIHIWPWYDAQTWCGMVEVPYCFPRSSIKFQGHTGQKLTDLDPNLAFPGCSSSLNWPMAMKWCTKLEVPYKMCPFLFQGHMSNFMVTQDKKITDFFYQFSILVIKLKLFQLKITYFDSLSNICEQRVCGVDTKTWLLTVK